MAYHKDSLNHFGDYAKREYGNSVDAEKLCNMAGKNKIRGYVTHSEEDNPMKKFMQAQENADIELSQLAKRNSQVQRGTQELGEWKSANPELTRIAKNNIVKAGGKFGDWKSASPELTQRAKDNILKAGGRYSLGNTDEDAAFAGLGDHDLTTPEATQRIKASVASMKTGKAEWLPEFSGLGEASKSDDTSWHTHFNKASLASTDTGVIVNLAKAVHSVPDNTSMEKRQEYYNLAMQMLHMRKKTNLRYLDIQRAEMESNLGWLVDPSLPKSGGFGKAVGKAIAAMGGKLGRDTRTAEKLEKKFALGKRIKHQLLKEGQLSGLGDLPSLLNNPAVLAGLGVALAGAFCYFKKNRKRR